MSKFEELCQSYSDARNKYIRFRDRCFAFAAQLVKGFVDYYEIPSEQVKFVPSHEDVKPNTEYSLRGSMNLDDDTYWHFGLILNFYVRPGVLPEQSFLYNFKIKEGEGEQFKVRIGDLEEEFVIDPNNSEDFQRFYDFLFSITKKDFEEGLQHFLDQEQITRIIGFAHN